MFTDEQEACLACLPTRDVNKVERVERQTQNGRYRTPLQTEREDTIVLGSVVMLSVCTQRDS